MKTVYANSSHPKLVLWSSVAAFIVGLASFLLYLFQAFDNEGLLVFLYIAGFSLIYGAFFYGQYKLLSITIDEEADTITDSRLKKYPLKISQLKYAAYKESKKGRASAPSSCTTQAWATWTSGPTAPRPKRWSPRS